MAQIGVVGSGAWGTTMGKLLATVGHDVLIWAHDLKIVDDIKIVLVLPAEIDVNPGDGL